MFYQSLRIVGDNFSIRDTNENTFDLETRAAWHKVPNEEIWRRICIRFRYDSETNQRLKTVELIVERCDWTPPPPRFTNDTLVPLRISAKDEAIRNQAKAVVGRWNPEKKLWFVTYGNIVGTPLERYIDVDGYG